MQGSVWVRIFQSIPKAIHDKLAITTVTGMEIIVGQFYRFEEDFMILRGRMAGTTEGYRLLIVPYAQIDFSSLTKLLSEEEIGEMFGGPVSVEIAQAPSAGGVVAPAAPANKESTLEPETTPHPAPADTEAPAKPGQISKTLLLARLRERLAQKEPKDKP